MTGLSSSGEAAVLTPLTTTAYVSLHTADPGNTGAKRDLDHRHRLCAPGADCLRQRR